MKALHVMKHIRISRLLALCCAILWIYPVVSLRAQTGINTQAPSDHAALHVSGTTKGVLFPRLTNAEATVLESRTPAAGMLIYNVDEDHIQVFRNGNFENLLNSSSVSGADQTRDIWVNDSDSAMVKLGWKSDGAVRAPGTGVVATDAGRLGIGTGPDAPAERLDVKGNLKFSGALMPGGEAGNAGEVLVSKGSGASPKWKDIREVSGTLYKAVYLKGEDPGTTPYALGSPTGLEVPESATVAVPGLTYTLFVPPGKTMVANFIIVGATNRTNAGGAERFQSVEGVFSLYHNGVKKSSAYAAALDMGWFVNNAARAVLLESLEVTGAVGTGTSHTFSVFYTAWPDADSDTVESQRINMDPYKLDYTGAVEEDREALLSKMFITIFNK